MSLYSQASHGHQKTQAPACQFLVLLLFFPRFPDARSVTPVNTSWATIPTGYFGGAKNGTRSDADIAALAQMRLVFIEKWEGPCWDECLANSSLTPPIPCSSSCDEEQYQLGTIARIKAKNPGVATAFYLNSLYDFPYYQLTGEMAAANFHLRDVNGSVIGMQNDNGMQHIPIFDWGNPGAVAKFLAYHRMLQAQGSDGTFPDKPNVFAFEKKDGANKGWWVCENPDGPPSKHKWSDACGEITAAQATAYNVGKLQVLEGLYVLYGKAGALGCTSGSPMPGTKWPVLFQSSSALGHEPMQDPIKEHTALAKRLTQPKGSTYAYFMMGDSGSTAMTCGCTPDQVVRFLLIAVEGAVLGCNGVGPSDKHLVPPVDWWTRPLGAPLGPPRRRKGMPHETIVERAFASGTIVSYDTQGGNGSIVWGNNALTTRGTANVERPTTNKNCSSSPAWPAPFCATQQYLLPGVGFPHAGDGGAALKNTNSTAACCCHCVQSPSCFGWTLNRGMQTCFLKGAAVVNASRTADPHCISAIMPPRPPPPPFVPPYPTPALAKNVLFLAVDDMRPNLGAYNFSAYGRVGDPGVKSHSPHLDKLAGEGMLFSRAYVQYSFCSPSRNSFMSGRRPDTTKVWEFLDHFREPAVGGDAWVTLPQFFKEHGYATYGAGKLYHPNMPPNNDVPLSWSPETLYVTPHDDNFTCAFQGPQLIGKQDLPPAKHYVWCEINTAANSSTLYGQKVRDACIAHLRLAKNASASARPFFVGCGFHKPHAPYHAPREFFDALPPPSTMGLPLDPYAPVGMPDVAWHPYADTGMGKLIGMTPAFNGTVNLTKLQVWRRAYYAAISYTDHNIGMVLNELDALGMAENTIVVVFGDHGYQLGEHATWSKMTNFELGVRIPLIIRAPFYPTSAGKESSVLAEMVDIYPTLADLAGLPPPRSVRGAEGINGTSLAPVFHATTVDDATGARLRAVSRALKRAAFSQFAKIGASAGPGFPWGTSVRPEFHRNQTELMGYTVRTDEWRYTAWFRFDNDTNRAGNQFGRVLINESLGTELYDHRGDTCMWLDWPGENLNLVNFTAHAATVKALHAQLLDYIQLK